VIGTGWAFVLVAAFAAGLVDAMAGGGGLIQLPALLATWPAAPLANLLGTNKLAGLCGTLTAGLHYAARIPVPWAVVGPGLLIAALSAWGGAWTVTRVSPGLLRPLVPILLTAALLYTLLRPDAGTVHEPRPLDGRTRARGALGIALVGFYDGFFGPGTGSFLMLLFIRVFGFDFLHAAASARLLNVATNAAALAWFGARAEILVALGLAMAVCNVAGAQLGARLALRHGTRFVRAAFVIVVAALIARTAWQAWG
jgi:uncharacterized membrane protein YfcA